jgi:hypothetical protein
MTTAFDPGVANPCTRHPEHSADQICQRCGDFICNLCIAAAGGHPYCEACVPRAGAGLPADVHWGVTEVLGRAISVTRDAFVPLFLLHLLPQVAALILLGAVVGGAFALGMTGTMSETLAGVLVVVLGVPGMVLYVWVMLRIQLGSIHIARAVLYREPVPGWMRAFGMGAGDAGWLFLTWLVIGAIFFGIFALGVAPALLAFISEPLGFFAIPTGLVAIGFILVLTVRWTYLAPVVVALEKRWGGSALRRASELLKGKFLEMVGIFVLLMVINFCLAIPGGIVEVAGGIVQQPLVSFSGQLVRGLFGLIGQLFALVVGVCAYYGLRRAELAAPG